MRNPKKVILNTAQANTKLHEKRLKPVRPLEVLFRYSSIVRASNCLQLLQLSLVIIILIAQSDARSVAHRSPAAEPYTLTPKVCRCKCKCMRLQTTSTLDPILPPQYTSRSLPLVMHGSLIPPKQSKPVICLHKP